jgi:cysteine desulfurase
MLSPVYLDYNATTPCDPRVVEAMLPYFTAVYGNPANGLHPQGRQAARAVNVGREQVAELMGAQPHEIVFTAGATESNNLAIFGLARGMGGSARCRIVTSAVEHKAVLAPCERLQGEGYDLVVLPVDDQGRVDLAAAAAAIDEHTVLVSVQAANNETGVIQPVAELAELAHAQGAIFHCDAAQALGKIPVDVNGLGVDLLSASAHKLYGPKGIGVLFVRKSIRAAGLEPQTLGGGQESGLRSGTTNVPAIVGFGEACCISRTEGTEERVRIEALRNQLEEGLLAAIDTLMVQSRRALRLPNTSSLTFRGCDADALLLNLPDVMMGTGSACSSGAIEPSHVLQAMGVPRADAFSTIRATLGRFTTANDIALASTAFVAAWRELP